MIVHIDMKGAYHCVYNSFGHLWLKILQKKRLLCPSLATEGGVQLVSTDHNDMTAL